MNLQYITCWTFLERNEENINFELETPLPGKKLQILTIDFTFKYYVKWLKELSWWHVL